jgi:hypothetical protein
MLSSGTIHRRGESAAEENRSRPIDILSWRMPLEAKTSSKVECPRRSHSGYCSNSTCWTTATNGRANCDLHQAVDLSRMRQLDNDPAVSGASRDLEDHGKLSLTVRLG